MNPTGELALSLSEDEHVILRELLSAERDRLQVEIRHTDHRRYRDQLRQRLDTIQRLLDRGPA